MLGEQMKKIKKCAYHIRTFICLLSLLSLNVYSDENTKIFGAWQTNIFTYNGKILSMASTENDSGSALGVLCMEGYEECFPFVNLRLSCEKDGEYPALVTVDAGVVHVSMSCLIIEKRYLYLLTQEFLNHILTKNKLGIVVGTAEGQFKSSHFTLNGSTKAVLAAQLLLENTVENNKNKNVDETGNSKFKDTIL